MICCRQCRSKQKKRALAEDAKRSEGYSFSLSSSDDIAPIKGGIYGKDVMLEGMEDIDAELTADLVGDYLFTDSEFVKRLYTEHRNVFEKLYDEVKCLCKVVTAGSKEARQLEKVKKAFEEAYKADGAQKNTAEGGVRYSLNIKHTDGTVEELADARELTNKQALEYLRKAKSGELRRDTYIPVRKDTPQIIIDTLKKVNDKVENLSLVMQVKKARQSMAAEDPRSRNKNGGRNNRRHALSPEEIVDILNNLDEPNTIIYQTNRYDKNGEPLPNNIAVFVDYAVGENEGLAVIEFESSIDPEFIGDEFGDTSYHTVVTVFEPDVERDGFAFDYAEELLQNPNNVELPIERRHLTRSATGEIHPNTSSELSSKSMITHDKTDVKANFSLSSMDENIAPIKGGIYGKDIALEGAAPMEDIGPVREAAAAQAEFEGVMEYGPVLQSSAKESAAAAEDIGPVKAEAEVGEETTAEKSYISMEDFANRDSSVWRNVDYSDDATKAAIMQETHNAMVNDGAVVTASDETLAGVEQSFPDLRGVKKKERTPILKEAIGKLKSDLRRFLNGFKGQAFELDVDGQVLEAKLYNTGINEVEKVTQEKANMLYTTEEIFQNARYLYSTPDYDGDPNVYRWNYFYTPVQIDKETVGVRIAVRDMATPAESQIYNWGIKKMRPWVVKETIIEIASLTAPHQTHLVMYPWTV